MPRKKSTVPNAFEGHLERFQSRGILLDYLDHDVSFPIAHIGLHLPASHQVVVRTGKAMDLKKARKLAVEIRDFWRRRPRTAVDKAVRILLKYEGEKHVLEILLQHLSMIGILSKQASMHFPVTESGICLADYMKMHYDMQKMLHHRSCRLAVWMLSHRLSYLRFLGISAKRLSTACHDLDGFKGGAKDLNYVLGSQNILLAANLGSSNLKGQDGFILIRDFLKRKNSPGGFDYREAFRKAVEREPERNKFGLRGRPSKKGQRNKPWRYCPIFLERVYQRWAGRM